MDQAFINTDGLFSTEEGKVQKKAPVQFQLSNTFTPFRLDSLCVAKRSVIVPNFSSTVNAALSARLI
jgi:hypothetical protein